MELKKSRPYFFIFTFLLILLQVISVSAQKNQDILKYVKAIYGTSDILVNGIEYLEENPRIKETPNLFSENWLTADIFIKGEKFSGCEVKYNIYSDQLVLKFLSNIGVQSGVVLDNALVDSIHIKGHMLISSQLFDYDNLVRSFVEYVKMKNAVIYISYYKEHIKFYSDYQPYGKYSDTKRVVYFNKDNKYFDVTKRRDFIKLFPERKKEIKRYLRKNRINYKTANVRNFETLLRINE